MTVMPIFDRPPTPRERTYLEALAQGQRWSSISGQAGNMCRKFGWCEAIYRTPQGEELTRSTLAATMDAVAIVKAGYRAIGFSLTARGRAALGRRERDTPAALGKRPAQASNQRSPRPDRTTPPRNQETPAVTDMPSNAVVNAPTLFAEVEGQRYAYRRFGAGHGPPLLCLQHFTGNLDNWDPLVTSALAQSREVILFDNAGVGRSSGEVPKTIAGMGDHVLAFLDALNLQSVDILGFSLGGMVAQEVVKYRPEAVRKLVLVGTAPRGGEDVMHLEKPSLAKHLGDPELQGYQILQKIFFTETEASQASGAAFIGRLTMRLEDREPISGPAVAGAQIAAFREWEMFPGKRFAELGAITQPTLVVNGVKDEMIPVRNSYHLAENLPNAVLLVYPDAGHGSLFQYPASFARHVAAFLDNSGPTAVY